MYEGKYSYKSYQKTLDFLKHVQPAPQHILDFGEDDSFSQILTQEGYQVQNTKGEDLDIDFKTVQQSQAESVTAFEIFEHLLAPFNVLKEIKADKLVNSIPLRLWFASAYRNPEDQWNQGHHEFKDWQFDWLLEKSGWRIVKTAKLTNPVKKVGIRLLLRYFTPRYYIVYAERNK